MATTGREQLRLAIGIINSRNTEWELPFRQMLNFEELTKTTLRSSKFHRGNLKVRAAAFVSTTSRTKSKSWPETTKSSTCC